MTLLQVTTVTLNQLDEDRWSPTIPGLLERELCTTDATRVFAPERSETSGAEFVQLGAKREVGESL